MRNQILATFIILAAVAWGCQQNETAEPRQETSPVDNLVLASKDSITSGGHKGIEVGADGARIYDAIQKLNREEGVSYVNVVSNFSFNLFQLDGRIPLYQYILLDETTGTDSGVQFTFEAGRVKSIYLNSGKKLSQWPSGVAGDAPVKVGDQADALLMKFARIRNSDKYAKKFERMLLLTKDLSTVYDPAMGKSPQWYFRYQVSQGIYEHVDINILNGKVASIVVKVYREM